MDTCKKLRTSVPRHLFFSFFPFFLIRQRSSLSPFEKNSGKQSRIKHFYPTDLERLHVIIFVYQITYANYINHTSCRQGKHFGPRKISFKQRKCRKQAEHYSQGVLCREATGESQRLWFWFTSSQSKHTNGLQKTKLTPPLHS